MRQTKTFNNCKHDFNTHDIHEILEIIGKRCHASTKARLKSILIYGTSTIPVCGILDRLVYENFKRQYFAGQSYPDEIRLIRSIILNGK